MSSAASQKPTATTVPKARRKAGRQANQDQRVLEGDPHPVQRAVQQGRRWQATELKARTKTAAS